MKKPEHVFGAKAAGQDARQAQARLAAEMVIRQAAQAKPQGVSLAGVAPQTVLMKAPGPVRRG